MGGSVLTSNATREQTTEQFRREERRDQYATVLQQATRLENAGSFSSSAFGALPYLSGLGVKEPGAMPPPTASGGIGRAGAAEAAAGILDGGSLTKQLGGIRDTWQDAYTAFDQAISNSEIASSEAALDIASALRDKYRADHYASILKSVTDSLPFYPDPKPDPQKLADALVGVPAEKSPPSYPASLLSKSADELRAMYVQAAKTDLDLNDR